MSIESRAALQAKATWLRRVLEPHFSYETAAPGWPGPSSQSSTGQCAAVAVIVRARLGLGLVSANVQGQGHWFNRSEEKDNPFDVDITGDQFGAPSVQVKPAGTLYEHATSRSAGELRPETIDRARLLARKAGLSLD